MKANIEVDLKGVGVFVLTETQQNLQTNKIYEGIPMVYGSDQEAIEHVDKEIASYKRSYGEDAVIVTNEDWFYKVVTLSVTSSLSGSLNAKIYYKITNVYLH